MATFEKTTNISAFATQNKIVNMSIMENNETKAHSVLVVKADGTQEFYRVSNKVKQLTSELAVSWFTDDDGKSSWMVHPRGEGKLKTLSSLNFTPNLQEAF